MEHKTKKLKQQCRIICEKLDNPDYEQRKLEKALRTCALLPLAEELDSKQDKKFEKKQKAALLNAFVCNYQWSYSDWKKMKDHPASQTMVRSLLWGYYQNGEIQKTFALKEDGQTADENGETISSELFFKEQGRIGLVHPEELTESERNFWKKYGRKAKWKQPFPQLKIPVCKGQYDLTGFRCSGNTAIHDHCCRQVGTVSGEQ